MKNAVALSAMLTALILFPAIVHAENREAVERHWKYAQSYLAKGWKAHAMEEAKVVLLLDPTHAGALSLVGSKGMQVASPVPAVETPKVIAAPADLSSEAQQAYRESRVVDARRFSTEVLVADPGNVVATGILADLASEEYQPSPLGANDVLKDLFEQGMGLWRKEQWEASAEIFQRALAIEVSHEQVRSFHDRARKRADSGRAVRGLAGVRELLSAGKVDEAREGLARVLALDPANMEAKALQESLGGGPLPAERRAQAREHFNRGVELYGQGKWAESVREWELVVSLDPRDEEAKRLLRKAQGKSRSAKKDSGRRIETLHEEAMKYYQQGKADEARKSYMAILELDPGDAKAKASLALMDTNK